MTYAVKSLAQVDKDHSRDLLFIHRFLHVTSDKQTQCFCRMELTVSTLMTSEIALLSQILSKLI